MTNRYEELSLLPSLIAEQVCVEPYVGAELSMNTRSQREVERIENLRRDMTEEQVQEFVEVCDYRCKLAWEAGAEWFMNCVNSRTNAGRDQLYIWISHWLAAYLTNKVGFLERSYSKETR